MTQQVRIVNQDCLTAVKSMLPVDFVFGSPPYEDARQLGDLNFRLKGDEWVQWAADRFEACHKMCHGLTAWVINGRTHNKRWSGTPFLLGVELMKRGIALRYPIFFHRVGVPGSGGRDYLRNDVEFILCASHGAIPGSDPTACGHPPKYPPGGAMSNRKPDGSRVSREYKPPKRCNPGNVFKAVVGGGRMGSDLAHLNEAPFPESLADFMVRTFCPPGGIVFDPFCGSGTTLAAALKSGRNAIGSDIRLSQCWIAKDRCIETGVIHDGFCNGNKWSFTQEDADRTTGAQPRPARRASKRKPAQPTA